MARARPLFLLLLTCLLLGALPTSAEADTNQLPSVKAKGAKVIVVDIRRGRDSNPGTARRPLRTVAAAWQRIPQARTLRRRGGVRILVRPGRYDASSLPNYWEQRWGTRRAPIAIVAQRRGSVSFASVNLFELRWVAFSGINFKDQYDLFHCERCQHVLLNRGRLVGSPSQLHENIKVNQSQHIGITNNVISGAGDNSIDFVAVQRGRITRNRIERAGDWCAYAKGGSVYILFARNVVRRCGTGGFTAGQGTGFQFMTRPYIRYEAYNVKVLDNRFLNIEGAGVGVNGGYQIVIARNRLYDVGRRSHWLEFVYGGRSCDGQPGDQDRERCQGNLNAGGWGTTRVDDGSNYVRIPNRSVAALGNVIDNPGRQGDQLFSIAAPYSGEWQQGSGLGAVRADDDLRISRNLIAGRGLPSGTEECRSSDCLNLSRRNELNSRPGLFRAPRRGDLRLRRGTRAPRPHLPRWR